jgi:hypothetical protein
VGLVLALSFSLSLLAFAIGLGRWQTRWSRLPPRALLDGKPRKSRALSRILARGRARHERLAMAVTEANALLWEGELDRAIAFVDRVEVPAYLSGMRAVFTLIKLESLVFDERIDEARALFAANAEALDALAVGKADVEAIAGFLRFHEGDLAAAQRLLEASLATANQEDPIKRGAHFCLAAIAHREGREEDTRRHLRATIERGADLFLVDWALDQWKELFPRQPPPSRIRRPRREIRVPRALVAFASNLWMGLGVLFFRTAALRRRMVTADEVAFLVMFDIVFAVALRGVDYTKTALFMERGLVVLCGPILFFLLTAQIAGSRRSRTPDSRAARLRLLAGFYGALPAPLIAMFLEGRRHRAYVQGAPSAIELLLGVWLLAVVIRLLFSVLPDAGVTRIARTTRVARVAACAGVFAVTWLLPMHIVNGTRLFYTPSFDVTEYEERQKNHDALIFEEADRTQAAEAMLANERPGVTDLYFVGAAAWASQDVFANELGSARRLFDEKFDTSGRSIILSNQDPRDDALPLMASPTLRHVIKAVGARMDRDEDVLFLFITSHGSDKGLAVDPPRRSAFSEETLSPSDLRSMLDGASIKWRVLVISGCESGVFIDTLRNDHTLIATASSSDRNSYGCAMGNPYTDFGRAVFGEELVHERSFTTAFTKAADVIGKREADAGVLASRPQISEGAAIKSKLRELEERLAVQSSK